MNRSRIARTRLTRDEARELRRRARMAGMTVSDFIRSSTLGDTTAADHASDAPTDPLAMSSAAKARA